MFDCDFAVLELHPSNVAVKFVTPLTICFHGEDVLIGIEFIDLVFKELFAAIVVLSNIGEETFCLSNAFGDGGEERDSRRPFSGGISSFPSFSSRVKRK